MSHPAILYQITASFFCAGFLVENGTVKDPAPIIKYMEGWKLKTALRYCANRGWKVKAV